MTAFGILLGRELQLIWGQRADMAATMLFFVLAAVLFVFGVGPEPNLLARMASGVVLVAALLAGQLTADRMLSNDFDDGSLEQLACATPALEWAMAAKVAAHWLTTGAPLILVAGPLALMLNLPLSGLGSLLAALALATPLLSLIGAVGAALVLGARRGGALLPLLTLPLYVPVLIFAAAAADAGLTGLSPRPHLLLLGGMLAAALPLTPMAMAAGVRAALD